LDFFTEHQCAIHYANFTLNICDTEIPLRTQTEEPRLCRIILGKSVNMPANSEMIVPGKLVKGAKSGHLTPGMVEAKRGPSKFTTGCTLVQLDHGKMPVRVANFTDEPIKHLDGSMPLQKSVLRKIQSRVHRTPRRMRTQDSEKDEKCTEARVSGGIRRHLVAAVDTTSVGTPCTPYPAEPPKNS
jgi:hypothetical protein